MSSSRTFDDILSGNSFKLIRIFVALAILSSSLKNFKTFLPDSATAMSAATVLVSEPAFHKQVALVREALLNF